MSRLSELIAELCPDGVEYKALGDVATLTDGSHSSPKATANGHPMPSVKDMRFSGFDFTSCKRIGDDDYELLCRNGCQPKKNDVLIAKDGSVLKHAFAVHEECDYVVLSSIAIVRPDVEQIDSDFLAYYFRTYSVQTLALRKYVSKSGVPRIILRNFKLIRIPVPPIEVQREIVRILDSFQELDDALTAEIEVRERQLKELRLGLTDDSRFNEKQLMPLSRVALFSGGHTPSKVELDNYADGQSGISWITSKDVKRDYLGVSQITLTDKGAAGLKLYPVGTTVMVTRSGILRHYLPIASMSVESTVNQDIRCICPKEGVNADYVFEVLKARADYMLRAFFNLGGTVDSINFNRVKAMVIPVPDINEQLRIVDAIKPAERLLDLLRSERDVRRKQFAYYRDKLLTFPEKVSS